MEDRVETCSGGFASPSLREGGRTAYETKFLVVEETARRLEATLRGRMTTDPHVDRSADSYKVTTLYFDTPEFDVYAKTPGYRTAKHRVRRYGDDAAVYLEWKSKRGQRVRKRRSVASQDDLARLAVLADVAAWDGRWFVERIHARRLAPVCRVAYDRLALCGDSETGPIRATFDRRLRGGACSTVVLDAESPMAPLPIAGVVVEFKFTDSMPHLFREAMTQFPLTSAAASKYRACIDALGLGPARNALHA
jgi:hypothetical protein